jgi:hypothetical protein
MTLERLADKGGGFVAVWAAAVYGEDLPPPDSVRDIRAEWNEWGTQAVATSAFGLMSHEQLAEVREMRESGQLD